MRTDPVTHLPISEATTAWDLWNEIIAAVEAEPKRLHMESWLLNGTEIDEEGLDRPACNTTCCWAGWAVTLRAALVVDFQVVESTALDLLSGPVPAMNDDSEEADRQRELRYATQRLFMYFPSDFDAPKQSPAYVAYVVKRARGIMTEYEEWLRSVVLPPLPPPHADDTKTP